MGIGSEAERQRKEVWENRLRYLGENPVYPVGTDKGSVMGGIPGSFVECKIQACFED